jgi:hypothetical protein
MSWLETAASIVVGPNVSSPFQSTHYGGGGGGGGGGDAGTGFNAFFALHFVSCPKPWIKRDTVDAALLESAVQNTALAENDNLDALLSSDRGLFSQSILPCALSFRRLPPLIFSSTASVIGKNSLPSQPGLRGTLPLHPPGKLVVVHDTPVKRL